MTEEHLFGIDFDSLPVTTMTAHFPKEKGDVNLSLLFWLIPWDEIKNPVSVLNRSKKLKLDNNVPCGFITSLRCAGHTRGLERIVKKSKKNFFNNCITMDVGTGTKSVCVKLFTKSIHVCGGKSEEMCKTAVNIVVDKIRSIIAFMDKWEDNAQDIKNYIKELESKGQDTYRYTQGKINFKVKDKTIIPPSTDNEVSKFFNPLLKDYEYVSQFLSFISFIQSRSVGTLPYVVKAEPIVSMTNFDYKLPWPINRKKLNDNIVTTDIFSRYNNTSESAVYVEIPHEKISSGKNMHTFMIRKSGTITQTGPRREMMREAFFLFIQRLKEVEDKVFKKKIDSKKDD